MVLACNSFVLFQISSCKEPVEPLTIDEIADRCHCPEEVLFPLPECRLPSKIMKISALPFE